MQNKYIHTSHTFCPMTTSILLYINRIYRIIFQSDTRIVFIFLNRLIFMICFKKIFKCISVAIYYLVFIYEYIIYIFPEKILLTLNMAFELKKSYLNECIRSYHRLTKNVELTTTPFPMGIQKASHVLSFRIPSAKAQMCERKKQVVVGVLVVPAIVFFF